MLPAFWSSFLGWLGIFSTKLDFLFNEKTVYGPNREQNFLTGNTPVSRMQTWKEKKERVYRPSSYDHWNVKDCNNIHFSLLFSVFFHNFPTFFHNRA